MIPVTLSIKGFLSYCEPVSIDFTQFDLAAISGANGSGKSSITDAMTWALFGRARRNDDAVIHTQAAAAEITFIFDYEGQRYRVQRSKPRGKTGLLEFFLRDPEGGWRPLTEPKMDETSRRIQQVLHMDYDTFTNASFFLQGKADTFAMQGAARRKVILSSILSLEVWEEYRREAAERRRGEETQLTRLEGHLREVEEELEEEDERRQALEQKQELLRQAEAMTAMQEEILRSQRQRADSLEQSRQNVERLRLAAASVEGKLRELEQRIDSRQLERGKYQQRLDDAETIQTAYRRWQEDRAELERLDGIAASVREYERQRHEPLMEIRAEQVRLEQELAGCIDQRARVQQSLAELPEMKARLDAANGMVREYQERLDFKAHLEEELREVQAAQALAASENERMKQQMLELKQRIDQLGEADGAECPLCGQPLPPDERESLVAHLQEEGDRLGTSWRTNRASNEAADRRQKEIRAELGQFRQVETDLRSQQQVSAQITARIEQVERTAADWGGEGDGKLARIAEQLERGDFAHAARQALSEIDQSLLGLGYDAAAHDSIRKAEQAGRASQEQLNELNKAEAALAPLVREIDGLLEQQAGLQDELNQAQLVYRQAEEQYRREADDPPDVEGAESRFYDLRAEEQRLRVEVGQALQRVEVLKNLRARQARLQQQCGEISRQIARLNALERAFSKDGIPALLIEQALPDIEAHANDLLERLSNGIMHVRLQTQRDYADKKRTDKRETLDILISDTDGQREYEMFSGGEAFRVNFAIRLALSRVLAQRSGARLQTLIIDEGFGSQDNEGRQRLLEAIAAVREDFEKILIITHLEELKDAFPARIEVEKTPRGSQVQVVVG